MSARRAAGPRGRGVDHRVHSRRSTPGIAHGRLLPHVGEHRYERGAGPDSTACGWRRGRRRAAVAIRDLRPGWSAGQRHTVVMTIRETDFALAVTAFEQGARRDAAAAARSAGKSAVPDWAAHPATYRIEVTRLTVTAAGAPLLAHEAGGADLPVALSLFNHAPGRRAALVVPPARPLVNEALVTVGDQTDPKALAPLIDRFGQAIAADRPGKVHSEAQLLAEQDEARAAGRVGEPAGFDRFGGWQRPAGRASDGLLPRRAQAAGLVADPPRGQSLVSTSASAARRVSSGRGRRPAGASTSSSGCPSAAASRRGVEQEAWGGEERSTISRSRPST